jgi:hypothetical protein
MFGSVVVLFLLDRCKPASYRNSFALMVSIFLIYMFQKLHFANIVYASIPYAFILSLLVSFYLFIKWLSSGFDVSVTIRGNLLLLFLPCLLFLSGSVSSAGSFGDSYYQLALFLLLILIVDLKAILPSAKTKVFWIFVVILYLVVALNSFLFRLSNPYSWHAYRAPQFGSSYEYLVDDRHGPRFIPKELNALIAPVCNVIGINSTLLSIPFSYANYHCGVKPWEGYVQTFFDTSSKELIDELIHKISISPPDYIFYQRQQSNLSGHESVFNSGKELPHRNLDRLIMKNIRIKKWKVVYSSGLYAPSEWMLIRTNHKND